VSDYGFLTENCMNKKLQDKIQVQNKTKKVTRKNKKLQPQKVRKEIFEFMS